MTHQRLLIICPIVGFSIMLVAVVDHNGKITKQTQFQ